MILHNMVVAEDERDEIAFGSETPHLLSVDPWNLIPVPAGCIRVSYKPLYSSLIRRRTFEPKANRVIHDMICVHCYKGDPGPTNFFPTAEPLATRLV